MCWQAFANQATLRQILVLGVKQDEIFVLVVVFLVLEQLKLNQITTLGGNGCLEQICTYRESFTHGSTGCRNYWRTSTGSIGLQG